MSSNLFPRNQVIDELDGTAWLGRRTFVRFLACFVSARIMAHFRQNHPRWFELNYTPDVITLKLPKHLWCKKVPKYTYQCVKESLGMQCRGMNGMHL